MRGYTLKLVQEPKSSHNTTTAEYSSVHGTLMQKARMNRWTRGYVLTGAAMESMRLTLWQLDFRKWWI